ncbi:MAG: hypothetical protein M3R02_01285 [Chloroflexota bacterium]|nr:hypothetical protein [Chloroflexota bacterium]
MPLNHEQHSSSSPSTTSLRDRVRGYATPPQPQPRPKRPLRQVEPEHIQLAILAAESCARQFFDEMAATPAGLMRFDRERLAEAIQQAVQEAVSRAWRRHPAIRTRSPFSRNKFADPSSLAERVFAADERAS